MKKQVLMIVIALLLVSVPGMAATNRYGMCKKDQEHAVSEVLSALVQGRDQGAWSIAVRDLVSAETCLLTYGEGYTSMKLYGRLAKDLKAGQFRVFGWRIFKTRLEENGVTLEPAATVFARSY